MKFVKSFLMGTGGLVLAGLILALLAPKAAHAIAATAVQIVNTTASPAIVSSMNDPGRIAYQSTNLTPTYFNGLAPNQLADFAFGPVPANHRLVVQHLAGEFLYSSTPSQVNIVYEVSTAV